MRLSVIIIAKNAADKIGDALKSVKDLGDETIVLDGGSTDETVKIAKRHGARIVRQRGENYSQWRNQGAKEAKGDWIFYLDADERVSPELKSEICSKVDGSCRGFSPKKTHKGTLSWGSPSPRHPSGLVSAYDVPRKNYVFGQWLKHGGWWPDRVLRLITKEDLIGWEGEVHEQPKFRGEMGNLQEPLIHLKEDSLSSMIDKTNRYSLYEAKLLFKARHPRMVWWRFLSITLRELWYRLVLKLGFLDGPKGIIFCLYQGYSRLVTYAKLWEMQNK